MTSDFQADIAAINQIAAVPSILNVACRLTGMGFAAVARVTEDRWIACSVKDDIQFGLKPGDELQIETTLCNEIRQHKEPIVIDNVATDDVYCTHHTPAKYGFLSYISMPIMLRDGRFFGTLCAIDPRPRLLKTPEIVGTFKLFAELIGFHLDAIETLASSDANLRGERRQAELREQFIAVLGHDLRNPLAAIDAGAKMLLRIPLDEKAVNIVRLVQNSVSRMSGLIDNVLDLARARLGGGFALKRDSSEPLEPVLAQVVGELRAVWPDRVVETAFDLNRPVTCDRTRVAQLLSNLVGNALSYGTPGSPVVVRGTTGGGMFELSVSNAGEPIPPAAMERLFEPFSRGHVRPNQKGLGLGLYIASEIARAHGGTLTVHSSPEETRFTFRMPLD
jgi:signal transduction histidine kinase